MKSYRVAIVALQEIHWKGTGIMDSADYTIFYSGGNKNQYGTDSMVANRIKQEVLGFKPVNERLCLLRLKFSLFNVMVFYAHASTKEDIEDSKDAFFSLLDREYDFAPQHDIKMPKLGERKLSDQQLDIIVNMLKVMITQIS